MRWLMSDIPASTTSAIHHLGLGFGILGPECRVGVQGTGSGVDAAKQNLEFRAMVRKTHEGTYDLIPRTFRMIPHHITYVCHQKPQTQSPGTLA